MTRPLEHPLTPDAAFAAAEAFPGDLPDDFDVGEAIAPNLLASRRGDGWTAERQRAFCDAVATGATVENAARAVGLSPSSAYAFRNSARGAAFGIGWTAASLIQRQRLSDVVMSRAFCGQTITVSRASGETVERHFFDNRLAMSVLTRLDRLAAGTGVAAGGRAGADPIGASQAQEHAARLAAGEWDRYLDLLAQDATPARAGLFLAQRTADLATPGTPELAAITALARADLYDRTRAGIPAEIDVADLDVAHRADWTAEQWARAEAAGLLTVAAPEPEPEPDPETHEGSPPESQHSDDAEDEFWWDHDRHEWRTHFPPPEDFDGDEQGEAADVNYQRTLTDEEAALMGVGPERYEDWEIAERTARRDAWFDALRGDAPPPVPAAC